MAKHDWEYDNAQEAIRATAARLFCANGVDGTSLADIAQEIHLSKGTLYYYYPSKDDLVQEIAELHLGDITAALFDWLDGVQGSETVQQLVAALADTLLSDTDRLRLHFALNAAAMRGDGELRQRFAIKHKEWSVLVELAAGRLSGARGAGLCSRSEALLCLIEGCGWRALVGDAPTAEQIGGLFSVLSS